MQGFEKDNYCRLQCDGKVEIYIYEVMTIMLHTYVTHRTRLHISILL